MDNRDRKAIIKNSDMSEGNIYFLYFLNNFRYATRRD